MRIEPNQIVNGGTYTENVENHGTIRGGVFIGQVDNFGGIEGGKFYSFVHVQPESNINNGEFLGPVKVNGTIKNGKFLSNVELFGGIEGGEFFGFVRIEPNANINNGKFYGDIYLSGNIKNGEFFGTVSAFGGSVISGGIFQGELDVSRHADISNKAKIFGPVYLIDTDAMTGRFVREVLEKPGVENFTDEIRKNNDYPAIIKKAMEKIIEEKNSYLGDQNDKNPLDLLALTQDFNDNIL